MNKFKFIALVCIFTIFWGFTGCSMHAGDKSQSDKTIENPDVNQQSKYVEPDSLTATKNELTQIYTQAIAEFIKAAYKNNGTTFDTLYFGKRSYGQDDDFPDIELPLTIEKTEIRLIKPEIGQIIQQQRKSLYYVNMMGWIDKQQAEFLFVVFSNSAAHQYDYYINFTFNNVLNKFELKTVEFENFLNGNGQNPKRIIIYKDGNYIDNR